jgi:hypothetical protein
MMKREQAQAMMTVAGFEIDQVWELPNGYSGGSSHLASCLRDRTMSIETAVYYLETPWWLIKTRFGCIKIGWRKRVINIDWSDTPFRGRVQEDKVSGSTDVTWGDSFTHAYGEMDATKYLHTLCGKLRDLERAEPLVPPIVS